jgi:hypothetical protein
MSRILRRPMFRGGPVDSRGTGITANLGYNNGGRVGYSNGGGIVTIQDILSQTGAPMTGQQILDYAASKQMDFGPNFKINKYSKYIPDEVDVTVGEDIVSKPFGEIIREKGFQTYEDEKSNLGGKDTQGTIEALDKVQVKTDATGKVVKDDLGNPIYTGNQGEVKEKLKKTDKIIDLSNTEGTGGNGNEEESTELTVKDYVKMLGGDKARRRDTSDLLAQASAAFLGTGSVREGLSEFMNQVAASGPGRLEKIEQAAASLDIKDKIASKRADEQLKMLLGRDDYQAMLKLRLSDPSLQSFETNLVDTAKSLGKSYKNMGVIGNTINKKYGSGSFGGEVKDDTNYVEGKYYIQDTGTGEKIVFKIVEGKAEEVHRII